MLKTVGVFVFGLGMAVLPSSAIAAPICGMPPTSVETYNPAGCEVDGLLFSEFNVVPIPGTNDIVLAMSSSVVGSTVFINFNPLLGFGPGIEDLWLMFKVSTLDGSNSITGVDLTNGGTPDSIITERVCSTAFTGVGPTCDGTLLATLSASGGDPTQNVFFTGRSSIWVFKDIGVGPNGENTAFSQSFHTSVPDGGSTLALLGLGLLGLRTARRRFSGR